RGGSPEGDRNGSERSFMVRARGVLVTGWHPRGGHADHIGDSYRRAGHDRHEVRTRDPGDHLRRVPSSAAWSPSGELIGFTTERGRVYVIRPDGTGVRQIAFPSSNCSDRGPAWSPDGSEFLFTRDCVDPVTSAEHAT